MAKKAVRKKRRVTSKEKKFVAEYIKNDGNGTKAALATYNTKSEANAASIASRVLEKTSVAELLKAELDKQGVTIEKVIMPVAKGLSATKKDGAEDYGVQLAAHDRAVKILGLTEPQEKNSPSISFNINKANFGGEFVKNDEN